MTHNWKIFVFLQGYWIC